MLCLELKNQIEQSKAIYQFVPQICFVDYKRLKLHNPKIFTPTLHFTLKVQHFQAWWPGSNLNSDAVQIWIEYLKSWNATILKYLLWFFSFLQRVPFILLWKSSIFMPDDLVQVGCKIWGSDCQMSASVTVYFFLILLYCTILVHIPNIFQLWEVI